VVALPLPQRPSVLTGLLDAIRVQQPRFRQVHCPLLMIDDKEITVEEVRLACLPVARV
jgi:hypothetical protein